MERLLPTLRRLNNLWFSVFLYGYGGYRQVVKASGCDSDMREFDPHYPPQAWMYSIMVVRLLHTESCGSSTLLTSTRICRRQALSTT